MSVIVLILKIIGIALLALLALILLVLLLVLTVPVRYRISGTVEGQADVRVKVTWLLHLVSWNAAYTDSGFTSTLRIFGIRRKEKQDDEMDEDSPAEDIHVGQAGAADASVSQAGVADTSVRQAETADMPVKQAVKMRDISQKDMTGAGDAVVQDGQPKTKERKPFLSRLTGIGAQIRAYFTGFRRKLFRIKETLLKVFTQASSIREMLADEANHIVFAGVFQEICYLLRHFRFRRIDADVGFSLGDPSTTGQAVGAVSVLPFIYRYRCNIMPDFESEDTYVRGSIQILGWARGVHAVISLLRLWRKREVRRLVKQLMHR